MHHQLKELADVDITKEPMEIGPTCHYVMGGVEVAPDTAAATHVPGLFAAGEVAGGMHGSNRLGGNSLSDLLVFGRRAGTGAAAYVAELGGRYPAVRPDQIEAAESAALAPFGVEGGENPYAVHADLQQSMNDLVGLIRTADEMTEALKRLEDLKARVAKVSVEGGRQFNPGWHLALDLRNMLLVCECVARAALLREESRGGHTRDDYPKMEPEWRKKNLICSLTTDGAVDVVEQPMPPMRSDLINLFDRDELAKYLTDEELPALSEQPAEEPTA
jgi:succinate dehydrogenase / fumarate reductase flavoprotein subunit